MSGASANIAIHKEGPHDRLEVEPEPINSADTTGLIQVLAEVRLQHAAACSLDSPKLPDAKAIIAGFKPKGGVGYRRLWSKVKVPHVSISAPA